jgi:hypothetical protein
MKKVNHQYKDSVFSALFNNPDRLRELYCALTGAELPPDTPVVPAKRVLYGADKRPFL